VARIRERQKAAQEFEEEKPRQERLAARTATAQRLYDGGREYSSGDRVEVELTYSEMLVPEEGIYRSSIPRSSARAIRTRRSLRRRNLSNGFETPYSIRASHRPRRSPFM
jgi:hypothetical protein